MSARFTTLLAVLLAGCAWSDRVDGWVLTPEGDTETDALGGADADGGTATLGGASNLGAETGEGGMAAAGPVCGDGVIDAGETCDDANAIAGDGCFACAIECAASAIQDPLTGHCYELFASAGNQPSAEANCQAWGGAPGLGHLASMGNQSENDLVATLVSGDTWIGADDFGGAFAWIDGTPFSFESWQTNEPNHPGVEHCMFMDVEGKWHDHDCGDATRPAYLCERSGAAP